MEWTLRDYQEKAVDETEAAIAFGDDRLILEACVGWGKSSYLAATAKLYEENGVVIMVNIEPLIDQISKTLTAMNVDHSILKAGRDPHFDPNKKVQLVMSQTFYARQKKLNLKAEVFCQDEFHREFDTQRTQAIKEHINPKVVIGTTATPYDAQGYALPGFDIIRTKSMKELIKEGYLVPIEYYTAKWSEKLSYDNAEKSGNDYTATSLDRIISTPNNLEQAADSMNKIGAKSMKTIIFCTSIEQCDAFTKVLRNHGYEAEAYHSKTGAKRSEAIMEAFRNNTEFIDPEAENNLFTTTEPRHVRVLLSVMRLSTGFDVPDIDLGVMLRKTAVLSLYIQSIGRIARSSPKTGKKKAILLDLAQNVTEHGFAEDPYEPPERTIDDTGKEMLAKAKESRRMEVYGDLMENDIEQISRLTYETRLTKLKSNKKKLTEESVETLYKKLAIENDPTVIVAIFCVLFDRTLGSVLPDGTRGYVADNGKTVSDFVNPEKIEWIARGWNEMMQDDKYSDFVKKRFIKAMKTRGMNMMRQQKSIYGLKYFIDFLLKNYEDEIAPVNTVYVNRGTTEEQAIEIDDSEVPF